VVDFRGPTAYPENSTTGYRSPSLFYFKMGLYRDLMAEPMTIYIVGLVSPIKSAGTVSALSGLPNGLRDREDCGDDVR
jgi:hypothetical protein